ncbi:MAG: 30S ribosomal protein S8 [Candidatus Berkelbacteria bacterium]
MDTIANTLVQIKNAVATSKKEVTVTYSKMKLAILETFKRQGLIESFEEVKVEDQKYPAGIKVVLKYKNNKDSVINNIKRVSRPGRRVYISATKIPTVKRGRVEVIISTSQGVLTGQEAYKKGLGGEIICEVE